MTIEERIVTTRKGQNQVKDNIKGVEVMGDDINLILMFYPMT